MIDERDRFEMIAGRVFIEKKRRSHVSVENVGNGETTNRNYEVSVSRRRGRLPSNRHRAGRAHRRGGSSILRIDSVCRLARLRARLVALPSDNATGVRHSSISPSIASAPENQPRSSGAA